MIKVTNVRKTFDGIEALTNVTLHIRKGSIYGLLGSNGAGKTTLLKMIAGVYRQESGEIFVNDEPVFENVRVKDKTIFMPDSLYFFPQATIQQMAQFYKEVYKHWSDDRFERLSQVFQIDAKRKVHRLSKGMQRQVAFWLSLSAMPDVLILDEPLDGLDAVMRQHVKNLLVQDVAEREMTVLISSHNLREVEDLCDSIGILHEGKLLIEKDLDDLKADVQKIQVAFKGDVPKHFLEKMHVLYREQRGSILLAIVRGNEADVKSYVTRFEPVIFDLLPLTLEEIFIYEMRDVGYAIENIFV